METAIVKQIYPEIIFNNFSSLENATIKAKKKLIQNGFINLKQNKPTKTNDSTYLVTYVLNHKIDSIQIHFKPSLFQSLSFLNVSAIKENYFTIPYSDIENTLKRINKYYTEKGDTFNWVQLANLHYDSNVLSAELIIEKSKEKRKINKVIVTGYKKFPKSYIKHFLKLNPENIFSKDDLIKKSSRIKNLDFASNLKLPEILFTEDSTTVFLCLKKENANSFDGFIGFANSENSNKLNLNGYIDVSLNNNLNYGEKLDIIYKNDGKEQQRFEASLLLPYLFNSPLDLEGRLSIFKQDSTFISSKRNINLTLPISNTIKMSLGYQLTNSNTLSDQSFSDIKDYKNNSIISSFSYKSNNIFDLKKTNLLFYHSLGIRKTKDSSVNQISSTVIIDHLFKLNSRNFIYAKNETSALFSENYLTNELFRIGGINSIRGFNENSLFSSFHTLLNTEYHYLLSSNIYAHTILDYGYTQDKISNSSNKLSSIGFGLGLKSLAGLFKLVIANGKIEKQTFSFTNTRIHIAFISNF